MARSPSAGCRSITAWPRSPHTAAGDEIARRLRVPAGTLLLTLFQVDRTVEGEVVLVSREHHLADAFDDHASIGAGRGDSGEDEV